MITSWSENWILFTPIKYSGLFGRNYFSYKLRPQISHKRTSVNYVLQSEPKSEKWTAYRCQIGGTALNVKRSCSPTFVNLVTKTCKFGNESLQKSIVQCNENLMPRLCYSLKIIHTIIHFQSMVGLVSWHPNFEMHDLSVYILKS